MENKKVECINGIKIIHIYPTYLSKEEKEEANKNKLMKLYKILSKAS